MIPAVSSFIGLIVKLILNILLVRIPGIGVNGAAIGSIINNAIVFLISYYILSRTIKLDIKFTKFVIKPLFATFIMCACSFSLYVFLRKMVLPVKLVTITSLCVAVFVYIFSIISLKTFTKEELLMIPYGSKLYKRLQKLGIYRET